MTNTEATTERERMSIIRLCCCEVCPMLCPPIPKRIIAKASLFPPKQTGYVLESKDDTEEVAMKLTVFSGLDFIVDNYVTVYSVQTQYTHTLCCIYIKYNANSPYTILYSHSNSSDNGYMCPYLFMLSQNLKVNVIGYDYSGYGWSTGKLKEKNLYRNVESVYYDAQTRFSVKNSHLIVMGSSIGSCPSVHLCQRIQAAGLILESAVKSGIATICKSDDLCCGKIKPYYNIGKIQHIKCPVLIVHGDNDKVVKIEDAHRLYDSIPDKLKREPLWISGVEHMECLRRHETYVRINNFIKNELGCNYSTPDTSSTSERICSKIDNAKQKFNKSNNPNEPLKFDFSKNSNVNILV